MPGAAIYWSPYAPRGVNGEPDRGRFGLAGFGAMRAPRLERRDAMTPPTSSRRTLLKHGSAALAGLSMLRLAGPASAFQTPTGDEVVPWLDQPEPNPVPEVIVRQLDWE